MENLSRFPLKGMNMAPILKDGDILLLSMQTKDSPRLCKEGDLMLSQSDVGWTIHRLLSKDRKKIFKIDSSLCFDVEDPEKYESTIVGFQRNNLTYFWGQEGFPWQKNIARLSGALTKSNNKILHWFYLRLMKWIQYFLLAFVVKKMIVKSKWSEPIAPPSLELFEKIDTLFLGQQIRYWTINAPDFMNQSSLHLYVDPKHWEESMGLLEQMGGTEQQARRGIFQFASHQLVTLHKELFHAMPIDLLFQKNSRSTCLHSIHWALEPCAEDRFVLLCGQIRYFFDPTHPDPKNFLHNMALVLEKEHALDWTYVRLRAQQLRLQNSVAVVLSLLRHHSSSPSIKIGYFPTRLLAPYFFSPARYVVSGKSVESYCKRPGLSAINRVLLWSF